MLALSVFTGVVAVALGASPDSLGALLPPWAVHLWAIILVVGSGVTLAGLPLQNINGIIIEQIGSVMVAASTLFYAILAFSFVGAGALQSVGIVAAWGVACAIRWFQLQALINTAYRVVNDPEALDSILEEDEFL